MLNENTGRGAKYFEDCRMEQISLCSTWNGVEYALEWNVGSPEGSP